MTDTKTGATDSAGLLRIQEVAAQIGTTPRSVRYWEEQGLLRPAARSEGDYRLYDATDVERLRFIKALRDDAGFSLAEIAQLLEDEAARERGHEAYHATTDPGERLRILRDRVGRYEHQIEMLQTKIERLQAMVDETEGRLAGTNARIAKLTEEMAAAAEGNETDPALEGEAAR